MRFPRSASGLSSASSISTLLNTCIPYQELNEVPKECLRSVLSLININPPEHMQPLPGEAVLVSPADRFLLVGETTQAQSFGRTETFSLSS
jgi:hypothetical protein